MRSFHHAAHAPERFLKTEPPVHALFHQVSEDFGVSLRAKDMAGVHQPTLQLQVILNDAVMHNGDTLLAVDMGMGILVRGTSVGGPARVAQAHRALGVAACAFVVQAVDLTNCLSQLDVALDVDYGYPGAIIASVLKPP